MILKNIKKKTYKQLLAYDYTCSLKVRKFENEYMKLRIAQNMNKKLEKFCPDTSFMFWAMRRIIHSFWNFLTFKKLIFRLLYHTWYT